MSRFSNVRSTLTNGILSFLSKTSANTLLTLDPDVDRVEVNSFLGFGSLGTPTVASGVLTVTQTCNDPQPETSTSDQVDTITMANAQAGDILIFHVPATNTITFDDANINLAAATRAVAPGGTLIVIYDGTQWSEMVFLAATDNTT